MIDITKEQYNSWKDNEVTKFVEGLLNELAEDRKNFLARGGTLDKESVVSTDFIVGYLQGLNEFLNIEYEDKETYDH